MPDLLGLTERQVNHLAASLDAALYVALAGAKRNGTEPGAELRQLAALIALAVPSAVVNPAGEIQLPSLLDAAGPQAAVAVKVEARRMAASRFDQDRVGSASSIPATLSASEAARIAGVSSQAIRAAAAPRGPLEASKSKVTGEWRIVPEALDDWMRRRRVA
jgi:hypothetical protein